MYSGYEVRRESDGWKLNENYDDGKENINRSSSSNNCTSQNWEQYSNSTTRYYKQPMSENTFPHCDHDTTSHDTECFNDQRSKRTFEDSDVFREQNCNCGTGSGIDFIDLSHKKSATFSSNTSNQQNNDHKNNDCRSKCDEGFSKKKKKREKHNEGTFEESMKPSGVQNLSKKGKKKSNGVVSSKPNEKCKREVDTPDGKECDNDENVAKCKQDTPTSVRAADHKRSNRTRRRNVYTKPPGQKSRGNCENDVKDGEHASWVWVLDVLVFLETGFEKIAEFLKSFISIGLSVVWYILVLLVLCICCLGIWLVSLLWRIPVYLVEKYRVLRADYDTFLKEKNKERFEPPPSSSRHYEAADMRSSDEVVSQLLASKHLNPYDILGVSAELATDEEIKRKYRDLAKIVHPDKNAHPESGEAFQILQSAFELISDEEKRSAYQSCEQRKNIVNNFDDFIEVMKQHVDKLKSKIMCSKCHQFHPRLLTDRLFFAARYCSDCNVKHSAKEGDVWVETSHLGFKYYCYLCVDGQVYEVTEWALCQGLLDLRPNTHHVLVSVRSNGPSYSPWDDLFGDTKHPANQHPKKKRNKCKTKSTGKGKKR